MKKTNGLFGLHQFESVKVGQIWSNFSGSQTFSPVALGPFLVDLGLGPGFLYCALTSTVRDLDQKFGQVQSFDVHGLSCDASGRSLNQHSVGVDQVQDGDQFALVWSISNNSDTADLYEFCVSLFSKKNSTLNTKKNWSFRSILKIRPGLNS